MSRETLHEGRYLRLVRCNGWEWVERTNASATVAIVAVTEGRLLLVEQHRPPVGVNVIELPAGLVGDLTGEEAESLDAGARRELVEETGYHAESFEFLSEGPTTAGVTSETVTFFLARGLSRVNQGGGDHTESIVVHEVPLAEVTDWLHRRVTEGALVDPKVFVGLYFLNARS